MMPTVEVLMRSLKEAKMEEDREEIAEVFEAYGWTVIDDFVRATREDQKQALRDLKDAVKAHCTEEEIYADLKVALKELLEGAA